MYPPVASSLHRVYHDKKNGILRAQKILDSRTKRCDNKGGLIILARGQKKKEYCYNTFIPSPATNQSEYIASFWCSVA